MSDDDIKFIIKKLTPETYEKFQRKTKKIILKKKTPPSTPINIEAPSSTVPSSSSVPSSSVPSSSVSSSSVSSSSSGWKVQPEEDIGPQLDKILIEKNIVMPLNEKMELLTEIKEGATKFIPPPCPPSDMASDATEFSTQEKKEEAPVVEEVVEPPVEVQEQKVEAPVEAPEDATMSDVASDVEKMAFLNNRRLLVRWLYILEYCQKRQTIPEISKFIDDFKRICVEEKSNVGTYTYSLDYDFLTMTSQCKLRLGYNKFITKEKNLCGITEKYSVKKWEMDIRENIINFDTLYSDVKIEDLEGRIEKITEKYVK